MRRPVGAAGPAPSAAAAAPAAAVAPSLAPGPAGGAAHPVVALRGAPPQAQPRPGRLGLQLLPVADPLAGELPQHASRLLRGRDRGHEARLGPEEPQGQRPAGHR